MASWAELRQSVKNHWDIEADDKLFTALEGFAERIIARSTAVSKSASELVKESINAEVELSSTINNLACLSSS
jgi:hypothetical protein